jgi:nucleoside-diphosphate-sugar epimerase
MDEPLIVVVGATGGCGNHITRQLILGGKRVRILVRDYQKAVNKFHDIWDKLEGVYVVDFAKEHWYKDAAHAICETDAKVSHVVSCMAATSPEDISDMFMYNFEINRRLISFLTIEPSVHFILISSFFVSNPAHRISRMLNKFRPNCLGYKNLAEAYLKITLPFYTIIRPGKLEGFDEDVTPGYFEVKQGDSIPGFIKRASVGKAVLDYINSGKSNRTFEVLTSKEKISSPYINYFQLPNKITKDKKEDIILYNHSGVVEFYKWKNVCYSFIFLGIFMKFIVYRRNRFKSTKF